MELLLSALEARVPAQGTGGFGVSWPRHCVLGSFLVRGKGRASLGLLYVGSPTSCHRHSGGPTAQDTACSSGLMVLKTKCISTQQSGIPVKKAAKEPRPPLSLK